MPHIELLLSGLTERGANRVPLHPAVVSGDDRLDYAGLHDAVLTCVGALRAAGIGKGDRVGYLGLNSNDYIILLQAALRIGAVTVAVNWRLVPRETGYIVADAGMSLLVTEADRVDSLGDSVPMIVLTDASYQDRPAFRAWIAAFPADTFVAELAPDDVAVQLYTSGTTGHPKGALLTHGSLSASLGQSKLIGEAWAAWDDSDVALVAMPQFHIGGTAWTLQTLDAMGTAVVLAKPEIANIIDAIERHGVTRMFAVPAVLGMILADPRSLGADLASLRALLYGASPIPLDILKRSIALFPNARFVQMYGSTETSGTIVYLPPEDHDIDGNVRMTGCGKAFPQVELRAVDPAGRDVAPGAVGEILVRSPLVMRGYHNLPDATEAAFDGDWYRTGDAGFIDTNGYLYLRDRVKDMIVSGAENIYPAEVEGALQAHPAVRDCAVIGVPDPRWGEAVKAIVVREPGVPLDAAALITFARDRIASYKVPKSVDFVDSLPRNAAGKILKKDLRELYWQDRVHRIG